MVDEDIKGSLVETYLRRVLELPRRFFRVYVLNSLHFTDLPGQKQVTFYGTAAVDGAVTFADRDKSKTLYITDVLLNCGAAATTNMKAYMGSSAVDTNIITSIEQTSVTLGWTHKILITPLKMQGDTVYLSAGAAGARNILLRGWEE